MTDHDDRVYLRHMLDHAREAVGFARDRKREDLDTDRLLQLALTHLVEIIGEAANRVSRERQAQHPEIPWTQIISMRNRLVHGYDDISFSLLWSTVVEDLPKLIAQLERLGLEES
jgi:uncharacterized protein with HEPN domain